MQLHKKFSLRLHLSWCIAVTLAVGAAALVRRSTAATPKAPRPAYTVKFENEKVRALEYVSDPHGDACGYGKHS
ncbi:MAG TPA: hypothetical protein VM029_02720, partial [Opitutaceae bacterium]|nr:hypothetical protein [Opitutaceae bacterium]